jgi:hypothetical protein
MAVLADGVPSIKLQGQHLKTTVIVGSNPSPHPIAGLSLILLGPNGGVRG